MEVEEITNRMYCVSVRNALAQPVVSVSYPNELVNITLLAGSGLLLQDTQALEFKISVNMQERVFESLADEGELTQSFRASTCNHLTGFRLAGSGQYLGRIKINRSIGFCSHVDYPDGQYSGVEFTISFHRLPINHLLSTFFPSTLLVALGLCAFLIDAEATFARISLSMTTLLTLYMQLTYIRKKLPRCAYLTVRQTRMRSYILMAA